MKHYYRYDKDVPDEFVKACIASLTKYGVNVAYNNPHDSVIEDIRITIEQLASYYCLCGIEKGAPEQERLEFIQPFNEKIGQARSETCENLTQAEVIHGVQGLSQYVYQLEWEGEDAVYRPDMLRCQQLISKLEETQQQSQSMDLPSLRQY
jgi:hypothetical protein